MGKVNSVIGKIDLDVNGNFVMNFEILFVFGIYNFWIGVKWVNFFFDGSEKKVIIIGDFNII